MEKKKSTRSNLELHSKHKSKDNQKWKQVYSIYTKRQVSSQKSKLSSIHEISRILQPSKNCTPCLSHCFNFDHLVQKYFAQAETKNRQSIFKNIIDDHLQNYATRQTIQISEALKFSDPKQNLMKLYQFSNAYENQHDLKRQFQSVVKNIGEKQQNSKFLLHYFGQSYCIMLTHFQNYQKAKKKLQNNLKKCKNQQNIKITEPTIPQNNGLYDNYFNFNQTLKKIKLLQTKDNYERLLRNSQLQSFTMLDGNNSESQKFINLVNQIEDMFEQSKKKRLKTKRREKINLKYQNDKKKKEVQPKLCFIESKSNKKSVSKHKDSLNSKTKSISNASPFRTPTSVHQEFKPNKYNCESTISSKVKHPHYQFIENDVYGLRSINSLNITSGHITPNPLFSNPLSHHSKTSTITPNLHSRFPSEIPEYHEITDQNRVLSYKKVSKCLSKAKSQGNSHTSTPKIINSKSYKNFNGIYSQKQNKKKVQAKNAIIRRIQTTGNDKVKINSTKSPERMIFKSIDPNEQKQSSKKIKCLANQKNKDKSSSHKHSSNQYEYGINSKKQVNIESENGSKFFEIEIFSKIKAEKNQSSASSCLNKETKAKMLINEKENKRSGSKKKSLSKFIQIKDSKRSNYSKNKKGGISSQRKYGTCNASFQNDQDIFHDYIQS